MGYDFWGYQTISSLLANLRLSVSKRLNVSKPKPAVSVSHESFNQENHSSYD